jgi:CRP-like cAMP-binding protein
MDIIQALKEKIDGQGLWSGVRVVKRNDFLVRAGAVDSHIYFIEEGTLRVFITDKDDEQVIRFGYKNSIITALDSFLTGNPTSFYLQAIKKCKVRAVEKKAFEDLLLKSAESTKLYLVILEQLVIQQMEREVDILTTSPVDRYKRVLARSPHLFQEIPNKYIASYLRMTPETLSRLKKTLI